MRKTLRFLLICFFLASSPCLAKVTPSPTQTPAGPTPQPTLTPRPISMDLYFRRPAKIVPWIDDEDRLEIVEEVPWLTIEDFHDISPVTENGRVLLRVYLNYEGNRKYRESLMGNIGRTIVLAVDGVARNTFKMVPVERKNRIYLAGDFTLEEAEEIAAAFAALPGPTPTPVPSPTPSTRKKITLY